MNKHLRPKCHICHTKMKKNPGSRILDKYPSWDCPIHGPQKAWMYVTKRIGL